MVLKKPSQFFAKNEEISSIKDSIQNLEKNPELNTVSEAFDAFKNNLNKIEVLSNFSETLDNYTSNVEKINHLAESVDGIKVEIQSLIKKEDLDNYIMSNLLMIEKVINDVQNKIKGINESSLSNIREDVVHLTETVNNFVEFEVPKYKKLFVDSELRVGNKFISLENKIDDKILEIDERYDIVDEEIKNLQQYLIEKYQRFEIDIEEIKNDASLKVEEVDALVSNKVVEFENLFEKFKKTFADNVTFKEEFKILQEKFLKKINDFEVEIVRNESHIKNQNKHLDTIQEELDKKINDFESEIVRNVSIIKNQNQQLEVIKEEICEAVSILNWKELQEKSDVFADKIQNLEKFIEDFNRPVLTEGLLNEPPETKNSDPLTPLNQNFVTLEQLQNHYRLFVNRIQQQLATLGGGGETKLKYLDDIVGIATNASAYDGKYLKYDHSTGKFIFSVIGGAGSQTLNETLILGNNSTLGMSVGVVTATSFIGNGSGLTNIQYSSNAGVSTYASSSGISTYATNAGVSTYASTAGIATYATSSGIATYATNAGVSTYASSSGIATYATSSGIASALTSNASVNTSGIITASSFSGSGTNLTSLNATQLTSGIVPAARITASGGDFTVGQNLYVNGSLSVGGTSVILNAATLQIQDRDIVVGYTTDVNNNDISTDNTANHGGISVASTVGSPLINIPLQVGINSNPATYKQFMWIKQGNYSGMGTDAWVSNYAISIGNTSTVLNGSRLTVGTGFTVFDTYLDATDIRARNINATGIVTGSSFRPSSGYYQSPNGTNAFYVYDGTGNVAFQGTIGVSQINSASGYKALDFSASTTPIVQVTNGLTVSGITTSTGGFVGNLTGTATTATNLADAANITTGTINSARLSGTYNINISGNSATATYADNAGISSYATSSGISTYATSSGISTYATSSGIATYATNAGISTYATSAGIATVAQGLTGTPNINVGTIAALNLNATGIVTGSSFRPSSGFYQSPNGTNAFYVYDTSGDVSFQGKIVTNYIRSNTNLNPTITVSDLDVQFARNVTISGVTTSTNGFVGNLTGTATTATNLANAANITTGTIDSARLSGTYNINISGNSATATYATSSGIATYANNAGVSTYSSTAGIATFATTAGISTFATASGIAFSGSTSGVTTVKASSVALGTLTLPATTDTLVGKATTDTFTNKTINIQFGQGNDLQIQGNSISSYTGSGNLVVLSNSPSFSTGINLNGSSSGQTTLQASSVASGTLTLPATTDTLVGKATTDTLTNKTLDLSNNTLTFTSTQLATACSDETGSGSLVFANSPSLSNVNVSGVITATTFNGQINAGVGTITILSGTTATYGTGNFTTANAVTGVVTTLSGTTATYGTGNFTTGNIVTGIVTTLSGTTATYGTGNFTTANAVTGVVTTLSGTTATYGTGNLTTLNATNGNIVTGIVTSLSGTNLSYSGVATAGSINIGATQVISSARQLQNISSLDATTTATIEAAIANAPNTFTDLNVTGISTLGITSTTNLTSQQLNVSGLTTFSGITTYNTSLFGTQSSFTGVVTASSFSGSGTNLTSLNASNLSSGIVPAARITASGGDFTVGQNLYVNGSLSVGGTSIILNAQQLQISDKDIIVGYTTDVNNNDISTDNTANHGGISVASTEGTPILNIPIQIGVNSNPTTYKQIMWIKQNNYSGMGTDAWVFNYGVSIGNTSSVQNGSRLTVGTGFTVFDTYLDATDIRARNINIGVGTITTLSGTTATYGTGNLTTLNATTGNIVTGIVTTLTGTTATYGTGNFTTANAVTGVVTTLSGTTATYGTLNATTGNIVTGIVTTLSGTTATYGTGNFTTGNIVTGIVTTLSGTTATYGTGNLTTLNATNGNIVTGIVTTLSGTTATYNTGNFTTGNIVTGIVTTLSGTTATYGTGNFTTGNIVTGIITTLSGTTATYGTGNFTTGNIVTGIVTSLTSTNTTLTNINSSGISTLGVTSTTNLTAQQLNVSGVSTHTGISTFQSSLFGTQASFTGVITATTFSGQVNAGVGTITTLSGTTATYGTGNFTTGNIVTGIVTTLSGTTATYGTGNFTTANAVTGVVTTLSGTNISYSGIVTFANGPVFIGAATSTGTATQRLQVTGGAYISTNLGVGVTNPTTPLHVNGDGTFIGNVIASGTVTANSDEKIKTNVKTISNALDKVISLRGVEYDRLDTQDHQIGVIAQEVEKVIPEVVYGDEIKSVAYGNLIGLLIEAIKEQNEEIQSLKKLLNDKSS